MIAVLQAAKEGKQIQVRNLGEIRWSWASCPAFDFQSNEYRVKPEPRKFWLVAFKDGSLTWSVWTRPPVDRSPYREIIEVTENIKENPV